MGAHERPISQRLPQGGVPTVDESTQATQPKAQSDLAADEALHYPLDSFYPFLPSLSAGTPWRHYLTQEPGAVVPHAGICTGGAGRPASLLRPFKECNIARPNPLHDFSLIARC